MSSTAPRRAVRGGLRADSSSPEMVGSSPRPRRRASCVEDHLALARRRERRRQGARRQVRSIVLRRRAESHADRCGLSSSSVGVPSRTPTGAVCRPPPSACRVARRQVRSIVLLRRRAESHADRCGLSSSSVGVPGRTPTGAVYRPPHFGSNLRQAGAFASRIQRKECSHPSSTVRAYGSACT